MDRVIVKAGTKTNMYNLFEDLQNYTEAYVRNVLQELFVYGGVNALTTQGGAILSSDTTMKVTGTIGQNYISIGAGYGLTDNMDYLYVGPGTTATLTTLSSGVHSLYVANGTYYSDPVDVMSGFAYAQAGTSQQNSRLHHNTVFMWDADPVTSGLWLADVTVSTGGVFASVTDKRQTNTLKLEQSVLPDNVLRTDSGYTQTLANGLVLPDVTLGNNSVPGLFTLISGIYSSVLNYTTLKDLLDRVHTQGTDIGTTQSTFRVGNSTSTTADGLRVITSLDPSHNQISDLTISGITSPALLTLISGVVSEYLSVARLQDLLTRVHTQGTDTGTTSDYFYVGNSTVGANDGFLVALEPDIPMPPKNIRITDAYSPTRSRMRFVDAEAQLAEVVRTGLISHEATVSLEWNYRDIIGDGGKGTAGGTDSGKFRITNSGGSKTWTANELIGYHLYLPAVGLDYKITANLVTSGIETVLTVAPFGHTTVIDGLSASSSPAIIHSNCDSYEIVVVPVTEAGIKVYEERYEDKVTLQSSPTIMQQTMNLFLGEKVVISIRAKNGNSASVYTEMGAGSFTKLPPYVTVQNYAKPYYVSLPQLDSTGAKVGGNTTPSGFTMTIVGWDAATDFEICYTTDASGPDFLNETHEKFTTRQRSVDIVASGSRTYNVAVRPLISGWVVAPAKTTSVVSGSAGSVPKNNAYPITNISFKTYSGTLSTYNVGVEAWNLSTCFTPAGNVASATTLDDSVIGSYITIGGADYLITDRIGSCISIATLAGVAVTSALSGTYQINTSKASRVLATITNWPADTQLTSVSIEQWSTPGRRGAHVPVVRWYQASMEAYADSLPLTDKGKAEYNQVTDLTILAQNGSRTIIVDYWDPTLDDNLSGFTGNITLYWKPYVATGRKTDNTSTPPIIVASTQVS